MSITVAEQRCIHRCSPETTMPTCDHCGAHVSEQFQRVFCDEQGRLGACPDCSANAGIAEVARHRLAGQH